MNIRILFLLLFALLLSNCSKEKKLIEDLNDKWSLIEYTNIVGEVYCTYDQEAIIWDFDDDKIKIDGRLVSPWAFTPCYELDSSYSEKLAFTLEEADGDTFIEVDDLGLRAKFSVDADEMVIEIISSDLFRPSTEGVKVFFVRS